MAPRPSHHEGSLTGWDGGTQSQDSKGPTGLGRVCARTPTRLRTCG